MEDGDLVWVFSFALLVLASVRVTQSAARFHVVGDDPSDRIPL